MDQKSWVCALCKKDKAIKFCLCADSEPIFCDSCISSHIEKTPNPAHRQVSIHLFAYSKKPGFVEHLRAKLEQKDASITHLRSNLDSMMTCMTDVRSRTKAYIKACTDYTERLLIELETYKGKLEEAIQTAINEAEDSLLDDQFVHPLTLALRNFNGDPQSLVLFSYKMSAGQITIPAMLEYECLISETQIRVDAPKSMQIEEQKSAPAPNPMLPYVPKVGGRCSDPPSDAPIYTSFRALPRNPEGFYYVKLGADRTNTFYVTHDLLGRVYIRILRKEGKTYTPEVIGMNEAMLRAIEIKGIAFTDNLMSVHTEYSWIVPNVTLFFSEVKERDGYALQKSDKDPYPRLVNL